MWKRLHHALRRLWRRPREDYASGAANDRARFWAEVREGQREAETNARP